MLSNPSAESMARELRASTFRERHSYIDRLAAMPNVTVSAYWQGTDDHLDNGSAGEND